GGPARDARLARRAPAIGGARVEGGARGAGARGRGRGRGRRGAHAREPAAGHRRRRRVRLRARRRVGPPGRHPAQPGGERQAGGTARARAEPGRGRVTRGVVETFTPLRVPFAGGLTDLKAYAERFGGVTGSATIDRGAKVTARTSDGPWRVTWGGRVHEAASVEALDVDLVRESALQVGYDGPPLELGVTVEAHDHGGLGA